MSRLKRKSFFVDEQAVKRAKKALGLRTESEVVRASIAWIAEMDQFWKLMDRTRATLQPGDIES